MSLRFVEMAFAGGTEIQWRFEGFGGYFRVLGP